MNDSLINQGIELMIYGMGTVYIFLIVLVCATALMSSILGKYSVPETPESTTVSDGIEPNIRAAIKAAIHLHRNRKK